MLPNGCEIALILVMASLETALPPFGVGMLALEVDTPSLDAIPTPIDSVTVFSAVARLLVSSCENGISLPEVATAEELGITRLSLDVKMRRSGVYTDIVLEEALLTLVCALVVVDPGVDVESVEAY